MDYKESWVPKNSCFWTVVLEKTLESPLDCKEIQLVLPKGDQSWVFIGRTDVEAEALVLCPPDAKNWLICKDPDAGKDWGQEEKGMKENEMVGWHHWLNGHEFGWTPGVGDEQGGPACCSPWGRKELEMAERLNWTEFIGRTDAEVEAPVLWLPHVKSWLIGKHSDAGKDWRQEKKGMTEDKMVGWHHQLSGHEFQQTPGDSEDQGSLACWGSWDRKEWDTTEQLNWTDRARKGTKLP